MRPPGCASRFSFRTLLPPVPCIRSPFIGHPPSPSTLFPSAGPRPFVNFLSINRTLFHCPLFYLPTLPPHPPSSHRLARTYLPVSLQSLTGSSPSALSLSAAPSSPSPPSFHRPAHISLSVSSPSTCPLLRPAPPTSALSPPAAPTLIVLFLSLSTLLSRSGSPSAPRPLSERFPLPFPKPFPEAPSRGEAPFRGFLLLAGSPAAGPSPQQPEPSRPHGLCPTRKNLRRKPHETLFPKQMKNCTKNSVILYRTHSTAYFRPKLSLLRQFRLQMAC